MSRIGGRVNDKAFHLEEFDRGLTLPLPFVHQEREEKRTPQRHTRVDNLNRSPFDAIVDPLLLCGDAKGALGLLPDESVQTVVTSPPYWSLRDYGVEDQIGRDDRLGVYIDSIVRTFDQVGRVLRDDGTVWLNVGDCYTSGNRRYRAPDRKNRARAMGVRHPRRKG